MALPHPILSLAVAPIDSTECEHLRAVLAALSHADPALSFAPDPESTTTRLLGESADQLLALCRRIERESLIPIDFAPPEIILYETIRNSAEGEGKYIRQSGGAGNYGHVKLRLGPLPSGSGIVLASTVEAAVIPAEYLPPIEEGLREAARGGILAGRQMIDFHATLYDGSCHETDSNLMAFRIAAALAFKEAARKASPVVLEPVMSVVFTVAESRLRSAMAEISARRGRVTSTNIVSGIAILQASIPLAEMLRDSGASPTTMAFEGLEPFSSGRGDADPAGSAVRNPWGPKPQNNNDAAPDPDFDWT